MKQGPSLPNWATGLIVAIVVVLLGGVGYKFIMGEGPRDPNEKTPPATRSYAPKPGAYTRDGVPVDGVPASATGTDRYGVRPENQTP